jgi:hypothetical protein
VKDYLCLALQLEPISPWVSSLRLGHTQYLANLPTLARTAHSGAWKNPFTQRSAPVGIGVTSLFKEKNSNPIKQAKKSLKPFESKL